MNKKTFFEVNPGQLLIEVLIAIGLISLLVASVVPLIYSSSNAIQNQAKVSQATGLAKQTIDATKAIEEEKWDNLYSPLGTSNKGQANLYHVSSASGSWQLVAGPEDIVLDHSTYNCSLVIDNVSRSASGDIESIYNNSDDDASTQKITAKVTVPGSRPIVITEYFTHWQKTN